MARPLGSAAFGMTLLGGAACLGLIAAAWSIPVWTYAEGRTVVSAPTVADARPSAIATSDRHRVMQPLNRPEGCESRTHTRASVGVFLTGDRTRGFTLAEHQSVTLYVRPDPTGATAVIPAFVQALPAERISGAPESAPRPPPVLTLGFRADGQLAGRALCVPGREIRIVSGRQQVPMISWVATTLRDRLRAPE